MKTQITKRAINNKVKNLGLEIQNQRGAGYSYFTCLETGSQIGEMIMICYLNQCTLDEWYNYAFEELQRSLSSELHF